MIGLAVKMTVRHRLHSCLQICAEICESQNFGRNASRVERSKPVYYCHGYLVRKTDGRIIRCCDRMKKTIWGANRNLLKEWLSGHNWQTFGDPCYIMDFLPKQVPMNCGGQFFEVETYLLKHYDCRGLRYRFVGVILKAMCYYPVSVQWGKWIEQPPLNR